MALDLNLDNLQKIHVFHRFFCDFPPFSSYFRNNLRGSRVFRCFEAHDESCSIRSAWRLPENTKANSKSTSCLAGGFNDLHPYLGKIPMFTNMFQLGWNHQLVVYTIFNHMFVWSLSQEHMSFPSIFFPRWRSCQASKMPQRVDRWMLSVGEPSLPVTVATKIITCLVGDPYKPSFATVSRGIPSII